MAAIASLPVPSASIPVAGFKDVYEVTAVEKALQDLPQSANEALRSLYEKMLRVGGQRFAVKPSGLPEMQALFEELPNFGQVLEHIRRQLALCVDSNDDIELPPILLLGDPGIGKTHFARCVSQLFGTGYGFVPMSSLTAGWVLSGASSQWKNAKPGKVFETFLNGEYANPVLMVDELDKASADGQYDPLGALYELLETRTAMHFVDEFAEIPIDASGAVWFATANDASRIPTPRARRASRDRCTGKSASRTTGAGAFRRRLRAALWKSSPCSPRARCGARCRRRSATPKWPAATNCGPRTWMSSGAAGNPGSVSSPKYAAQPKL